MDEIPEAPTEQTELGADKFEIERLRKMKVLREAQRTTKEFRGV